jgi:hypothetical protein
MVLFLAAGALAAREAPQDEVSAHLQRIKKVGRKGKGNADAAKAWKAIVARGNAALLPILSAMDDDDLTSANWLRPAFESIAEKSLAAGKGLPKADLEKFINQKKHAGIARRLAYEWLVKVDARAPDRLLPTMLLDPSPELRRDAVARAIEEADALLAQKNNEVARAAYQKVLAAACDPDQVAAIATALGKLGVKVDLAKHFGFVMRWHLIAPFDHHNDVGWNKAYPPEKGVDLSASYKGKAGKTAKWVEHTTKDAHGKVDLNKALGKMKGTVAYAHAVVQSPKARLVELRAGCINGLKIFLNGKEIFAREEYHHGSQVDQYAARGMLKAGLNEILLKVCQNEQDDAWAQNWEFQLRICEPVGAAAPFTEVKPPKKPEAQARGTTKEGK